LLGLDARPLDRQAVVGEPVRGVQREVVGVPVREPVAVTATGHDARPFERVPVGGRRRALGLRRGRAGAPPEIRADDHGGTVTARSNRARYSRWDGTQIGFDLDADALLEEMTDDLLYHGDLNAALRRMMQQGFRDRQGRDVQGMREMLERLREQRREQLD